MNKPYQIVIDTNVLLTGLKSKKGASYLLLTLLNSNFFELNISTTLIFEYEYVLKRESQNLGLTSEDIDNIINGICHLANHQKVYYLWRPLSKDPNDDFIIDLAIKSQADFIISYNQKDLKTLIKFNISILNPKQFLQILGVIKP
jgi:putative PIN family toxin of toxin-antitoxin system